MDSSAEAVVATFFEKREEKYRAKDTILAMPGSNLKAVMYLVDGIVEQYDITPEGNKVIVNIFKPGSFFPMSWAINNTPNSYFFAALSDVRFKQAAPEAVVQLLKDNPEVAFDLLSRVYKGTDAILRRLVLASSGMASARLIFELIVEAYRFGVKKGDGVIAVKVKQGSLAARSGLARETVSRELHKLERAGLVELRAGEIVLRVDDLEKQLDVSM